MGDQTMDTMEDQMKKQLETMKSANDAENQTPNVGQNGGGGSNHLGGGHQRIKSNLVRIKSAYKWDKEQVENQKEDMKKHLAHLLANEAKHGIDVNEEPHGSQDDSSGDLSEDMESEQEEN